MASDSIIARPINNVRVIAFSASGCRARASSAIAMARPIAMAGSIAPMAMASAAATVDPRTNHVISFIQPPVLLYV